MGRRGRSGGSDSQGLHAGGMLVWSCSEVSHFMLTGPGEILVAPRPTTVIPVSRGIWTWKPTGANSSLCTFDFDQIKVHYVLHISFLCTFDFDQIKVHYVLHISFFFPRD